MSTKKPKAADMQLPLYESIFGEGKQRTGMPVKLVIDASAFKGDRVTLISCVSNSTYYLQRLVSNTEYVGRHCGRPAIEDGGTKLVYKVYGTRVIIR